MTRGGSYGNLITNIQAVFERDWHFRGPDQDEYVVCYDLNDRTIFVDFFRTTSAVMSVADM